MKKLLSLALTLLMMISAFVIPCTTAQGKAVKKKPNTYIASEAFYNTSNGVFYSDGMNIMIKNKDGETKKIAERIEDDTNNICKYYVRKDFLYYNSQKNGEYTVNSIKTSGKKKTVLFKSKDDITLIGGYGSGVIFQEGYKVRMLRNNKVTTLIKKATGEINIFNGKIYYGNKKVYNLETGKTKSFKVKKMMVSKNYLYYLNVNNKLKRVAKNTGEKDTLATNVKDIYGANNGQSVIFSKLNGENDEVLYRRTGLDKTYTLCTLSDIVKVMGKTYEIPENNPYYIESGAFASGKVCFSLIDKDHTTGMPAMVQVNSKGGTPRMLIDVSKDKFYPNFSGMGFGKLYSFDNALYYRYPMSDLDTGKIGSFENYKVK
ncbi:MAG: hypothetical protein MSH11_06560 [Ruminococcus sp.]|nr:hypothetical protein [Ruminococcus sp.]